MRAEPSRRRLLLLAVAAAPSSASGDDFWNRKPPEAWTAGETFRLVNQSPWAKRVQAWRPGITDSLLKGAPTGYIYGPTCIVTWESAQPVRDALRAPLPPEFAGSYVIGVDGLPLGEVESLDSLGGTTRLRSTGNPKWTAALAATGELIRNSSVSLFGFLRGAAPILHQSGELIFERQIGPWALRASFRPKDMLYRRQPAI